MDIKVTISSLLLRKQHIVSGMIPLYNILDRGEGFFLKSKSYALRCSL